MPTLVANFANDSDAQRCIRCLYALEIAAERVSIKGISTSAMRAAAGRFLNKSTQDRYILRYALVCSLVGFLAGAYVIHSDIPEGLFTHMGLVRCVTVGTILGCMFGTLAGALFGAGATESETATTEANNVANPDAQLSVGINYESPIEEKLVRDLMEYCGGSEIRTS